MVECPVMPLVTVQSRQANPFPLQNLLRPGDVDVFFGHHLGRNGFHLVVAGSGRQGYLPGVELHMPLLNADRRQGPNGGQVLGQANGSQHFGQFARRANVQNL